MNKVILMGRLTRDPEINNSANGKVARYTLAIDRRGRDKDAADYPQVVCFGHAAEFAEKYLTKGKKILVTGRIQTGKYVNRKGDTVHTTDVVAEDHEFPESKGAETREAETREAETREAETREADDFVPLPDTSEMPFR